MHRARTAAKKATKPQSPQPPPRLGKRCLNGIWRDLYAGDRRARVKRDLERADAYCVAFEEDLQGQGSEHSRTVRAGRALAEAVMRYEALDDLLGRLISYAGLIHAGNTADPARAKFYGDVQERITAASLAPSVLHARVEPDRRRHARQRAMAEPALGHYRPWIEDMRKDKPYQLEDRVEQLFHEKSVTGLFGLEPAVRRDHRGAALQGRRQGAGASSRRSTCCRTPTRRSARRPPRRSPRPSRRTCALFTLITNTLAKDKEISDRWRGFEDVADCAASGQPRRAARSSRRWWRRCAPPIRGCRTATTR